MTIPHGEPVDYVMLAIPVGLILLTLWHLGLILWSAVRLAWLRFWATDESTDRRRYELENVVAFPRRLR